MNEQKLDITAAERKKLRAYKIKVREIHHHSIKSLQGMLNSSKIRAMELFALSEFQSLPSIGVRFAHDLISMGYYSLKDLKGKDGAKLTDQLERQIGAWSDPCVEDQFRLVVYYANSPDRHKTWWAFTPERKAFREKHGYPANRPKRPWFELEQYQTTNRIKASKEVTKRDLQNKLKPSIQLLKRHLDGDLSLARMADASHLSPFHFLRTFKSVYDSTPLQYLTKLRLKKACRLLKTSSQTVSQIVPRCGFENESSFIRLFRREFKVTPMVYRKFS